MKLNNSILKPIITEKTYTLASDGKYVFEVSMGSTKNSVKSELTKLYGVDIEEVSMLIMPGKSKRVARSRVMSKPKRWKKAIVKVKKGQTIDLFPKE